MKNTTLGFLSAAAAATLLGVAGCSSSDRDSGYSRSERDAHDGRVTVDRSHDDYDRDRYTTYDRERYSDRDYDRTRDASLSSERLSAGARVVNHGQGEELAFTADRSGNVYAYDVDSGKTVYSGHLHRGERFLLNPNGNRATVNGEAVLQSDLKRDHRFEIRFQPD
jgi:hypothetical protein